MKTAITFKEIENGKCFIYENELMMKVSSSMVDDNVISLVDGGYYYFRSNDKVIPCSYL